MDTDFGYVCSDLDLEDKILGQGYDIPFGHAQVWDIFRFEKRGKKLWQGLDVNRQTGGRTGSDSSVNKCLLGFAFWPNMATNLLNFKQIRYVITVVGGVFYVVMFFYFSVGVRTFVLSLFVLVKMHPWILDNNALLSWHQMIRLVLELGDTCMKLG